MSDLTPPPPPGGAYPPPPPSGGGYSPPPPGAGGLPTEAYTSWVTRVLAYIIDFIPAGIVLGIGYGIMAATMEQSCVGDVSESYGYQVCPTQTSGIGTLAQGLSGLVVLAYVLWNLGYRQGTTGSSIGKSVMKFKVVGESTGQPIGFGMSVVRQLAHFVDSAICGIGYLFPLWDSKRQTIADKLIKTVCLPI